MAKGPKYGEFDFPSDFGFNGSSGKTIVKGYARGGSKKQAKVEKVMHEFGKGELHSGKNGPVVKNPKQAIAIGLSEAGLSKKMAAGGSLKEVDSDKNPGLAKLPEDTSV